MAIEVRQLQRLVLLPQQPPADIGPGLPLDDIQNLHLVKILHRGADAVHHIQLIRLQLPAQLKAGVVLKIDLRAGIAQLHLLLELHQGIGDIPVLSDPHPRSRSVASWDTLAAAARACW